MTKGGENKFGRVVDQRVMITPKISKNLARWIEEFVEGRSCEGYYEGHSAFVWVYEFEARDIIDAWESEEVEPEVVKELSEFVQFLQDEKVDYIMFPEGL